VSRSSVDAEMLSVSPVLLSLVLKSYHFSALKFVKICLPKAVVPPKQGESERA
jgi:hypothetical protein